MKHFPWLLFDFLFFSCGCVPLSLSLFLYLERDEFVDTIIFKRLVQCIFRASEKIFTQALHAGRNRNNWNRFFIGTIRIGPRVKFECFFL